jgi:hypothetical protein
MLDQTEIRLDTLAESDYICSNTLWRGSGLDFQTNSAKSLCSRMPEFRHIPHFEAE